MRSGRSSVDLFKEKNFPEFEETLFNFFDIFLMAKAKNIYASEISTFSELSLIIGNSNLIPIKKFFSNRNFYDIICKMRQVFSLDKEMLALSACWIYRNRTSINISKEKWYNILQQLLLGLDNQITIYCLYIDLYLFFKRL